MAGLVILIFCLRLLSGGQTPERKNRRRLGGSNWGSNTKKHFTPHDYEGYCEDFYDDFCDN
jgi:hypothetical protein